MTIHYGCPMNPDEIVGMARMNSFQSKIARPVFFWTFHAEYMYLNFTFFGKLGLEFLIKNHYIYLQRVDMFILNIIIGDQSDFINLLLLFYIYIYLSAGHRLLFIVHTGCIYFARLYLLQTLFARLYLLLSLVLYI